MKFCTKSIKCMLPDGHPGPCQDGMVHSRIGVFTFVAWLTRAR